MIPLLTAIALLVPSGDPQPKLSPEAQKELKKLEGKWQAQKFGLKGMEIIPGPNESELIGEFKGTRWSLGGIEKAEISALDPKADPKCIDFKNLEKGRGDTTEEAIYKLEGDVLSICLYQGKGKKRPTGFDVPRDPGTVLIVLKRVKG